MSVSIELDNAEPFRIIDIIPEYRCALVFLRVFDRLTKDSAEAVAVEDIVAQNHSACVIADKLLAEQERLCQTIRTGLNLIRKIDAKLTAVSKQMLKARRVLRRRNDENIADARKLSVESG